MIAQGAAIPTSSAFLIARVQSCDRNSTKTITLSHPNRSIDRYKSSLQELLQVIEVNEHLNPRSADLGLRPFGSTVSHPPPFPA
jgi:hypothetical protein